MYAHMKEVKQRLTRKFNLKNISPLFQRKLTEAVMQGAVVEEIVLSTVSPQNRPTSLNTIIWKKWFTPEAPATVECRSANDLHAGGIQGICQQTHRKPDKQRSLGPIFFSQSFNETGQYEYGQHQPQISSGLRRDASLRPSPAPMTRQPRLVTRSPLEQKCSRSRADDCVIRLGAEHR